MFGMLVGMSLLLPSADPTVRWDLSTSRSIEVVDWPQSARSAELHSFEKSL